MNYGRRRYEVLRGGKSLANMRSISDGCHKPVTEVMLGVIDCTGLGGRVCCPSRNLSP
ncbi:acyl-CoA thioesterase 12 [Anopheles sinensis]|uniref:Acyl-CoA thioesterase 12 n=1 Tax=Anopheles sinensis TaxID=74873 RepID=A0A084WH37_ANOSI|nr:acyl-CoA thioesterase 12 [Anopheles sinensis]